MATSRPCAPTLSLAAGTTAVGATFAAAFSYCQPGRAMDTDFVGWQVPSTAAEEGHAPSLCQGGDSSCPAGAAAQQHHYLGQPGSITPDMQPCQARHSRQHPSAAHPQHSSSFGSSTPADNWRVCAGGHPQSAGAVVYSAASTWSSESAGGPCSTRAGTAWPHRQPSLLGRLYPGQHHSVGGALGAQQHYW